MKTKPFGVRFEQDLLTDLKMTPQQALNFLTKFYQDNKPKKCDYPKVKTFTFLSKKEEKKIIEGAKPARKAGESGIDYAIRLKQWKEKK